MRRLRDPFVLAAIAWAFWFHADIAPVTLLPAEASTPPNVRVTISPAEKSSALRLARRAAALEIGLEPDPAATPEDLPVSVPGRDAVFVTLYGGSGNLIGCRGVFSGPDAAADIVQAAREAARDSRFEGGVRPYGPEDLRVVVSFLSNRREARWKTTGNLRRLIEPGVHAVEVQRGQRRAIFLESVPIIQNCNLEQTLQRLSEKAGLAARGYRDWFTRVFYYDVVTFTGTADGRATDLYRYNVLVGTESLSPGALRERIDLAAGWFRRNLNPNTGLLEYLYDPALDRYRDEDNHIRRLACLWAMASYARFAGRADAFEGAIAAGLDHYLKFAKPDGHGGVYLDIEGKTEIATGAFAALTLIEWPGYPEREKWIRRLADGLVYQQEPGGAYRTFVGSPGVDKGIEYYPGEAMLALMNAHRELRDPAYLASVERAFPFYQSYWRRARSTAFVPWHSQADLLLFEATRTDEYAWFVFELNDWLIENHQARQPTYPETAGGFTSGTNARPANSTASYLEGINAAYRLAGLVADRGRAAKYARSIRDATRCLLQMQYTKDNSFYLKNPNRALGGFTESLSQMSQRNDFTQHAIRALMAAYENQIF